MKLVFGLLLLRKLAACECVCASTCINDGGVCVHACLGEDLDRGLGQGMLLTQREGNRFLSSYNNQHGINRTIKAVVG